MTGGFLRTRSDDPDGKVESGDASGCVAVMTGLASMFALRISITLRERDAGHNGAYDAGLIEWQGHWCSRLVWGRISPVALTADLFGSS